MLCAFATITLIMFRIIFTLAVKSVSFENNLVAFTVFLIRFGVKVNW